MLLEEKHFRYSQRDESSYNTGKNEAFQTWGTAVPRGSWNPHFMEDLADDGQEVSQKVEQKEKF